MNLTGQGDEKFLQPPGKEQDWSQICDQLFNQYEGAGDDVFGLDDMTCNELSDPNDVIRRLDFSKDSDRNDIFAGPPSLPHSEMNFTQSSRAAQISTNQPKAKPPADFWSRTMQALEQNADEFERRQQMLRSTKSYPELSTDLDFQLAPPLPPSPTNQIMALRRQRSRVMSGANTTNRVQQSRSLSRGRPAGVLKPTAFTNPYATIRKSAASPSRALGFQHRNLPMESLWQNHCTSGATNEHEVHAGPSLHSQVTQSDVDDFLRSLETPLLSHTPSSHYDPRMSPLMTTFQHASIQADTPPPMEKFHATPLKGPRQSARRTLQSDTAPFFPDDTPIITPKKAQEFDFGFDDASGKDSWCPPLSFEPFSTAGLEMDILPNTSFPGLDSALLPSRDIAGFSDFGMGIDLWPPSDLVPLVQPDQKSSAIPDSTSGSRPGIDQPFWLSTPRKHHKYTFRSRSPPLTSTTESRVHRREASRSRSQTRSSRGRRAKSATSTVRRKRQGQSSDEKGFVNYTPQDSNKILQGVAPSGSSKTKARREKEAADRRRQLSQAAIRAVADAGGDLEALTEAGLYFF